MPESTAVASLPMTMAVPGPSEPDSDQPWSCFHAPDNQTKTDLSVDEIKSALDTQTGMLWVDVDYRHAAQTAVLEARIFTSFDQSALREIFSVKRLVLSLRRHLAPERDVFAVLTNRPSALLNFDTQVYFRDIHDHILRINDALETYRELLSNTLDAYLTQVSNRLGSITKTLSVVATVSLPFVVISGMWGMNFDKIPLHFYPGGFWILVGLQLAFGAVLLIILKWRKLL